MNATVQLTRPALSIFEEISYSSKTDVELVMLCQISDRRAFQELIKRHQRTIYSQLYKLAPDLEDTADIAQEASIRIWRGISKLKNPKVFRSWLNQIVTNLFYDELRKRSRQLPSVSLDQQDSEEEYESYTRDIEDERAGPAELLQRKELNEVVTEAMESLPEQYRQAIILREVEDLSYEEIGVITQTELGTVKSRISRARTKVQNLLVSYLGEERLAKSA